MHSDSEKHQHPVIDNKQFHDDMSRTQTANDTTQPLAKLMGQQMPPQLRRGSIHAVQRVLCLFASQSVEAAARSDLTPET